MVIAGHGVCLHAFVPQGRLISTYVDKPYIPGVKQALANLGMNCYLKMLLKDNYIHGDLHPVSISFSADFR